MIMNPASGLFMSTLMAGTFITICSKSWLGAWVGLEINLLSFIPLMINTSNQRTTEAALKYFLTQALASLILLLGLISSAIFSEMMHNLSHYSQNILIMALLIKMGSAPFHFWFPGVMEGLDWTNCIILSTWQKIAPLSLLSYVISMEWIITTTVVLSSLMGSLGGLNQTSLRKILAYSSINHLSWMIMSLNYGELLWITYFSIYSLLSITIMVIFSSHQMYHINQMFLKMNDPTLKHMTFISLLSLGGLPPLLGFLPKWLVILKMVEMNQIMIASTLIFTALVTLYFYMRISYSALLLNNSPQTWNLNTHPKTHIATQSYIVLSLFGMPLLLPLMSWL
uniref:NADH-ubiquinone oxidoreductase chain 2 n=1 Tax=Atelura formicaria TaxID=459531 RepID=B5KMD3_9INSE|nr:NADH dehydrogenase subunit 2 [Atelura formicaria]ABS88976.1 NADH dehydrogenase subunit 2 [Atelura formicaria]